MGKKTKDAPTQALPYERNTEFKWMDVPKTPEFEAFQNLEIERDPSLPFQFGRQRQDFLNTFQNPMGAYTTPEMRRNMTQAGLQDISQNEGQANREANFDFNRLNLGKAETEMNFTRPQLVTPKEWGTQTQFQPQQQGGGFWSGLLGGAGSAMSGLASLGMKVPFI